MHNYRLRNSGCYSCYSSRQVSELLVFECYRGLCSRNLSFYLSYVLSQSTDDRSLTLGSRPSICHLRRGALDMRAPFRFGDVPDSSARLDHIAEALKAFSTEDLCMHMYHNYVKIA